ncbi:hypothetical protein HF086_017641 [Spodoptera exigua]|uniref:Uncharacterized protein n=1 Tax=Spodoptera exigua TaxID=7107 RepID=A0A922MFT4_SPOEX|nr:hypothetical protein HF086_017641 [Spodoptera exigua]
MTVCQGSLIMLGSYCPKTQHKLGTTAMLAFAISKSSCMTAALVLGATHGALYKDYENATNILPGAVGANNNVGVHRPLDQKDHGALPYSRLLAILLNRNHDSVYTVNFLMNWPASKPRVPIAALIATVVTFVYGQTTFCEDVYFAVGEYPSVFMRLVFAGGAGPWGSNEAMAGWLLLGVTMLPIVIFVLIYGMFKCRVRLDGKQLNQLRLIGEKTLLLINTALDLTSKIKRNLNNELLI